jgi:hypothetical protein
VDARLSAWGKTGFSLTEAYDAAKTAAPTATENANAVLDVAAASHNTAGTIGAKINAAGAISNLGPGATEVTVLIDFNGSPLDGVEAWVSTDSAGDNVIAGTVTSNASGEVLFMLDAGTYYLWRHLAGYTFPNPTTLVVT